MFWADENSYLTSGTQLYQPGITVWGALPSKGVVESVFFLGSVNGESYLDMLREVVVSQLQTKSYFNELFFQLLHIMC